MIWLMVVMCVWILLLTAGLIGALFRMNEMQDRLTALGVHDIMEKQAAQVQQILEQEARR